VKKEIERLLLSLIDIPIQRKTSQEVVRLEVVGVAIEVGLT